jgi:hypothetical protein
VRPSPLVAGVRPLPLTFGAGGRGHQSMPLSPHEHLSIICNQSSHRWIPSSLRCVPEESLAVPTMKGSTQKRSTRSTTL